MNAAELSCRVATIRTLFAASASSRLTTLSPGTVKAILTPALERPSARTAATVLWSLRLSVGSMAALLEGRRAGVPGGSQR
jgi:hypothetical protein